MAEKVKMEGPPPTPPKPQAPLSAPLYYWLRQKKRRRQAQGS